MEKEIKEKLRSWSEQFGLNIRSGPENDKLKWALDPKLKVSSLEIDDVGELLFVLSSYHYSLSAEMGRAYALVCYDSDPVARAKLNIVKPQQESIALKISVVKKIFDKKIREHMRSDNA
jgi:hypothetical protein